MFTRKVVSRTGAGRARINMVYGSGKLVEHVATLYWQRYQAPLFISETASSGSVRKRERWLDESVQAVRSLRAQGVPLLGYTWWPLFALVTWGYRQGVHPPAYYFRQMGLWDLDENQRRIRTPLVDRFRDFATGGLEAVGSVMSPGTLAPATVAGPGA
jgi:hypothetical protein